MENFDSLISKLLEITNKQSLFIKEIEYTKQSFDIILSIEDYNKIHQGDIIIFNNNSKQYRRFKYNPTDNDNQKVFICDNIILHIHKEENPRLE